MSTINIEAIKPELQFAAKFISSNPGATKEQLLAAVKFIHAYYECSDSIQAGIREMFGIVSDESADADDKELAMATLADALFPNPFEGQLGLDLEQSENMGSQSSDEYRDAVSEMDSEEIAFAERLESIMKERGLTQSTLAELSGVGQPAISNMLKRQCRPQRRTVLRFSKALGVSAESLWPGFSAT